MKKAATVCWRIGLVMIALSTSCRGSASFEILIIGGTLVDGTGLPARLANVGIRDGEIVWVGEKTTVSAADTIDATGLVVAPGFIDVHSHTPFALMDSTRRWNEGVIRQGVTTVVGGPDGGAGPWTVRPLIEAGTSHGFGTNVAFYVGHNAIRDSVMGDDTQRAPTEEELETMRAMVREGMELGAVGFSTGLMYEPGMFSETDEVVELAKEVAQFGGIYDSHVRNPVHGFVESDREAIEIGRRAGIPTKIGHIKAVGLHNEGSIAEIAALVEEARASGHVVVSDQYPYDGAATTTLARIIVLPEDLRTPVEPPDLKRLLSDRRLRARIKVSSENGIDGGFAWLKATGYSSMRITSSTDYPDLVGRYLSVLAVDRGLDPFDLVSELILGAKDRVGITLGAIKEHDVREMMTQSWNMIASDGGYSDGETPRGHPRSTGTFPRVLGRYVREWNVLTLEDAVRKMTSLPAETVRLTGRGRIETDLAADIAVFDPATIIDRSTWDEPHLFSTGVIHVLVNGVPVLRNGELTGESPGVVITRQQ